MLKGDQEKVGDIIGERKVSRDVSAGADSAENGNVLPMPLRPTEGSACKPGFMCTLETKLVVRLKGSRNSLVVNVEG